MRYTPALLFASLILIGSSSCTRYYYKPNGVNAPLFTDGGQAHLNIGGSVGSQNGLDDDYSSEYDGTRYTFDIQASYSPVKHLGIIANYSTYGYTPDNPNIASGNVDGKAHLLEFGAGGYYTKGRRFKLVTDLYAGYGFGQITSDVDMRINRIFLQPGIGMRSPGFDAVFNLRIVGVKYSHFDPRGRDQDYLISQKLMNTSGRRIDNTNYAFVEPSFTIRGGYKFIKAQIQTVFAQEMTSVPWEYSPYRYTVGLYFSLEDAIAEAMKNR